MSLSDEWLASCIVFVIRPLICTLSGFCQHHLCKWCPAAFFSCRSDLIKTPTAALRAMIWVYSIIRENRRWISGLPMINPASLLSMDSVWQYKRNRKTDFFGVFFLPFCFISHSTHLCLTSHLAHCEKSRCCRWSLTTQFLQNCDFVLRDFKAATVPCVSCPVQTQTVVSGLLPHVPY